jgi:hypothetical protein
MRELTAVGGPNGFGPTAKVTLRTGREIWVCDDVTELDEAMEAGVPFRGHKSVAFRSEPVTLNPAHVAAIEPVTA